MPYMIERANAVAEQLERFSTGYAHHVVGQYANLEFWIGEARSALDVLEGYGQRFDRLASAQKVWVDAHQTKVGSFCSLCGGACELEEKMTKPAPPRRYASAERATAKRRLTDAAYHFFRRCYRMNLLDEDGLRAACARLDMGVDLADL